MKPFSAIFSLFLLMLVSVSPALAASRSWDGRYDATETHDCQTWIDMTSWTVTNNEVYAPYGQNAPIGDDDRATVVENDQNAGFQAQFLFFHDDKGNHFTANWVGSKSGDHTVPCQGTIMGDCVTCFSLIPTIGNIGGGAGGLIPIFFFFIIIVIIIVVIFIAVQPRPVLQRVQLPEPPPRAMVPNPPGGAAPAGPGPAAAAPASPNAATPARRSPRAKTPVYGKKTLPKKGQRIWPERSGKKR